MGWNAYGLSYVPGAVLSLAAGALIYFRSPLNQQNRRLSLLLFANGMLCAGIAVGYMAPEPRLAVAAYSVLFTSWLMFQAGTIRLAASLPTPLVRLLAHRVVDRTVLALYCAAGVLWVLVLHDLTFSGVGPFLPFIEWRPVYFLNTFEGWSIAAILASLVLVVASVDAFRRSEPGSTTRRRMRTYMVTAAISELLAIAGYALRFHIVSSVKAGAAPPTWQIQLFLYSTAISTSVYLVGLAYAILKDQVFDIDLKIKKGAGRTVAVGLVAALFFTLEQVAEAFLPFSGRLLPGILAAGVLALAFLPLQRLTFRILDRLMPTTTDTAAYRAGRKAEVYSAAAEELLGDGTLTDRERRALDRLRQQLELGQDVADDLERRWRTPRPN